MGVLTNVMARIALTLTGLISSGEALTADVNCGLARELLSDALCSTSADYLVNIIALRVLRDLRNASVDDAAAHGSAFLSDYANDTRDVIGAVLLLLRLCLEIDACMRGDGAADRLDRALLGLLLVM